MSTTTMHTTTTHNLSRGARRTYRLLLNGGGWWSQLEIRQALDVMTSMSIVRQLHELHEHQHVMRRGAGVRADPYKYGVTAACTPVPGVELEVA